MTRVLDLLLLLLVLATTADATTPAPRASCGSPSASTSWMPTAVFGRRHRSMSTSTNDVMATANQIRGGAVAAPDNLEEVERLIVKAGLEQKLVVIDFSATWCGPCKMIAPLYEELSESITDVVFIKIDVDENPDTAAKYNVSAMPTFLFIKGGEVVDRLMGANPERLQELINEHK